MYQYIYEQCNWKTFVCVFLSVGMVGSWGHVKRICCWFFKLFFPLLQGWRTFVLVIIHGELLIALVPYSCQPSYYHIFQVVILWNSIVQHWCTMTNNIWRWTFGGFFFISLFLCAFFVWMFKWLVELKNHFSQK